MINCSAWTVRLVCLLCACEWVDSSLLQAAASDPVLLGKWPEHHRANPNSLALAGNYLYLPAGDLMVYDVSDPTRPQFAGWCPLGQTTQGGIAVSGDYVFVTGTDKLKVFDIRDPRHPQPAAQYATKSPTTRITISGDYAYVGEQEGVNILNICNPLQPQEVSRIGYYTFKNLAVSGTTLFTLDANILHVLNIENPAQPIHLARWADPQGPDILSLNASGSFLYLKRSGDVSAVDVSNLAKPLLAGKSELISGNSYGLVVAGRYAYANSQDDFNVLDLSAANQPVLVGTCRLNNRGFFMYPGGIAVRDHYAFVAVEGFTVVDIAEPTVPRVVNETRLGTRSITIDERYAYVADEGAGLRIVDVSDSSHPVSVGAFVPGGSIYDVFVKKPYAYLANSEAGLQIVDISDPADPQLAGECLDIMRAYSVRVSGDYAYVDAPEGFCVIDVHDPAHPEWISGLNKGGKPLALRGSIAYTLAVDTLKTIDIQDPFDPKILGSLTLLGIIGGEIAFASNYAYLPLSFDGLAIVDVLDPQNPNKVSQYVGPSTVTEWPIVASGIAIQGNRAYVADRGMFVLDISEPTQPVRSGGKRIDTFNGSITQLRVQGNRAYLAAGQEGLLICGLAPEPPKLFERLIRRDAAGCHVVFQGPAGQSLRIQKSQDLVKWTDWQTVVATGQEQEQIDDTALSMSMQFYRILAP